ncbi:MAG: 7-cyano-7-deazaguanine synthase QueC [Gammaproteobacteria bacterium]|nr:7-cyano-7-deazaguanine synthase QueC [Gammaproteobacteria bacterium]
MSASARKAVVLVSGGLDSATVLAIANHEGYACYALSFEYGQRHRVEIEAAARVVANIGAAQHRTIQIDLAAFGGSALTDRDLAVPEAPTSGIPITYVPARNSVFLALALAWAETLDARDIFIGVNAVDYSGYPDCRPEFIAAFAELANVATRFGSEGGRFEIHAPLIALGKSEIIQRGAELGVDYAATVSCYQPTANGEACGRCESCRLRRAGFAEAGLADPTRYAVPVGTG